MEYQPKTGRKCNCQTGQQRDNRPTCEGTGMKVDFKKIRATSRLEYLRGEIEAERISMEEIAELQSLVKCIEPGDVLLLEWAGVPEGEKK